MINLNEYFEGDVKSLAYQSADGKSTVGVMNDGLYEFGTTMHETISIIEGHLQVQLPGTADWETFHKGGSFEIAAGLTFQVKSNGQTAYLCKYK
ncbi:MAG: pyrimidine/purine nucleoside phosphorylase [Sphingobacteriaceae bacterium]